MRVSLTVAIVVSHPPPVSAIARVTGSLPNLPSSLSPAPLSLIVIVRVLPPGIVTVRLPTSSGRAARRAAAGGLTTRLPSVLARLISIAVMWQPRESRAQAIAKLTFREPTRGRRRRVAAEVTVKGTASRLRLPSGAQPVSIRVWWPG